MIDKEVKTIIEKGVAFVGTSANNGLPNITVVDGIKVNGDGMLVISDVQMTSCRENLISNNSCVVVVYDEKVKIGYKIFGLTRYEKEGKNFNLAKKALASSGHELRGIFLMTPSKVVEIK